VRNIMFTFQKINIGSNFKTIFNTNIHRTISNRTTFTLLLVLRRH
jgi:hypothetical protein